MENFMAIIGPEQLPVVLKLPSDPIKFEVLSQLGHPVVMVELTEPQLEQAIRVTGDFIAQYFPLEEKYAYFYTQPLVTEYDLPPDAYWIKDVKWDPATTRIGDIFGAESFLFCFPKATKILDKDNRLQEISEWKPHWKAKTPYGNRKAIIYKRNSKHLQQARQLVHEYGTLVATVNHPIFCLNKNRWLNNDELELNDVLVGIDHKSQIISVKDGGMIDSYAVAMRQAQCLYVAYDGEPVLVH
jgi:hypothetical protein